MLINMNGSCSLISVLIRYLFRGRYGIQCDVQLVIAARQLPAQRGWDVGISVIREVSDTFRGRTLCEYSDMRHIMYGVY